MLRIDSDAHVWEVPEPAGTEGRTLFRAAQAVIGACGWVPPVAGMAKTEIAAGMSGFVSRVAAHPGGHAVVLETLKGGTLDGAPVTAATLDALPFAEMLEPYEVCLEAWMRLGFFGPALARATRQIAEAKETPSSE